MSDYESYFTRRKKIEDKDKDQATTDEVEVDDYFQKKRLQRNALLARHNEVEDTFKTKESLSSVVGYTGKNAEEPKKVDDRIVDIKKVQEDLVKRKEQKELRTEDRRAMIKKEEELTAVKEHWNTEDRERAMAQADEENYLRGKEWKRREAQIEHSRREREKYRDERRMREEENAVKEHLREKEWQTKKEQESLDYREWARVQERRKRLEDRETIKAAFNVDFHDSDPYAELVFRETDRRRRNWDGYKRRLDESGQQFDELKKWYKNKSLDRAEKTHIIVRNTSF